MTPRLNPFAAAPAEMRSWLEFGQGALGSGLAVHPADERRAA